MNILLIGMPGSGKSTVATLLSEYLPTFQKIEIDDLIINKIGCSLEQYINKYGVEKFKLIENNIINKVIKKAQQSIISPGGSIVYYHDIMDYICKSDNFLVIHLHSELDDLLQRTECFKNRGVIMDKSVQFPYKQLFNERMPLYSEYSKKTFYTSHSSPQETTIDIINYLYTITELYNLDFEINNNDN